VNYYMHSVFYRKKYWVIAKLVEFPSSAVFIIEFKSKLLFVSVFIYIFDSLFYTVLFYKKSITFLTLHFLYYHFLFHSIFLLQFSDDQNFHVRSNGSSISPRFALLIIKLCFYRIFIWKYTENIEKLNDRIPLK